MFEDNQSGKITNNTSQTLCSTNPHNEIDAYAMNQSFPNKTITMIPELQIIHHREGLSNCS